MRSAALALACSLLIALPAIALAQRTPGEVEGDGKPIGALKFKGNKKAEDDAIKAVLQSQVGTKLVSEKLRDDLRSVWKLGYFDDVQVESAEESNGKVTLTFVLREKPTIRKIYVSGASELGIDKINEVLDLKKETILDPAKVKRNVEKIRDLYVEKGFYLADVSSEVQRKDQNKVDVYFIVDEHAKVEVRQVRFFGNHHVTDADLKAAMGTQEGGWLSFLTSSGTYREDAFDRDLLLLTAFYYDRGYINVKLGKPEIELSRDKQYMYITIPIDEGPGLHDRQGRLQGRPARGRESEYFGD